MIGRSYALATGPDGSLYAGGDFTAASGVDVSRIARWDGTWHGLGTGVNGSVRAVAVGADNSIYAGGGFATASSVAADQHRPLGWDDCVVALFG